MSNVTLSIGGRQYRVACADGQEDHIVRLGAAIDEKLSTMGDNAGSNEARTLLFAALLLADEVYELKQQPAVPVPPAPAPDAGPDVAPPLEALAERLENLAASLEGQAAST
jgi:cell division protein ZapA